MTVANRNKILRDCAVLTASRKDLFDNLGWRASAPKATRNKSVLVA